MLDIATVERIAELAKLGFTEDEKERLAAQLSAVLDYIHQIASLDTSSVAADALATPPDASALRLRADDVAPSLPRDAVLANAPNTQAGQFFVPRFLDGGWES